MAWDTITGAIASTATKFGGEAINKISNWLTGSASETANIYDSSLNIVDPTTTTKKMRFDCGSITASNTRVLNMPDHDVKIGKEALIIAAGDETTAITVADGKTEFQMPYAFTLTEVRATLTTAGSTSGVTTIDIEDDGTSIFSTLLTIDSTEKTSTTAATPAVISGATIADGSIMKINVDVISGGATEAGLKISFIGYQS